MNTKEATNQIRLANWANIVKARSESGLTINEYCEQNGISRGSYFYWLRKLRHAALEAEGTRFVELREPLRKKSEGSPEGNVTVEMGDIWIRVSDPSARDTFAMVMEVLRDAE